MLHLTRYKLSNRSANLMPQLLKMATLHVHYFFRSRGVVGPVRGLNRKGQTCQLPKKRTRGGPFVLFEPEAAGRVAKDIRVAGDDFGQYSCFCKELSVDDART